MLKLKSYFDKPVPWNWYGLAAVLFVLDQITKVVASANLDYARPVAIFPSFNLTLHHNHGAAFSIFADWGGAQVWFLSILAIAVSVVIIFWLARLGRAFKFETLGLALILSGALGNVFDRIAYGYVIDFLDFYLGDYHWPAFNVADIAITCGAGCLLVDAIFGTDKSKKEAQQAAK